MQDLSFRSDAAKGLFSSDGGTMPTDRGKLAIRRTARAFPATRQALTDATAFLDQELETAECPVPIQSVLDIVLDEIASNIVAYSGASGFELGIEFFAGGVKLGFRDDGKAYNPLTHQEPDTTLSAEERPIGGLGIMMVKKMTNSVTYSRSSNHNILSIVKAYGESR